MNSESNTADRHQFANDKRRALRALTEVLILAAATAIVLIFVGVTRSASSQAVDEELVSSGLQLLAVSLLGTAVAVAWRRYESERDRERQQHDLEREERQRQAERNRDDRQAKFDMQLQLFRRMVSSYNATKSIRRTLRSYGLDGDSGTLNQWQVDGFREQMVLLNEVQLEFEALKREIGEARLFDHGGIELVEKLDAIESYLNKVLGLWESSGAQVHVGVDTLLVSTGLKTLLRTTSFKEGIVTPRRQATLLMQDSLFGEAGSQKLRRLQQLDGLGGDARSADEP